MPELGLGRRPAIDPRNAAHPMARHLVAPSAAIAITLPTKKTWAFDGSVLDQRSSGTCTGHAGAHFIHCAPLRHKGFLNPFTLYREAVLLDEYGDNDGDATITDDMALDGGSSGTGVAKALDRRGLLTEYVWGSTLAEIVRWVQSRGPVMLGSNWYSSMFNPTLEGFVKIAPNATIDGGHEFVLRGVDTSRGIGNLINSWSPRWNSGPGKKCRPGHFLASFETLERLMHEDGDGVSAIEKAA